MKVKVKKLNPDAKLPEYKSSGAAGADLYYCGVRDITISVGDRKLIPTGVAMEIPKGYVGLIRDKSGNASKKGLMVMAGVIDSDYRGEIQVLLRNTNWLNLVIEPGDAIAQILIMPLAFAEVVEVLSLDDTERGSGGFGSTGGGIK